MEGMQVMEAMETMEAVEAVDGTLARSLCRSLGGTRLMQWGDLAAPARDERLFCPLSFIIETAAHSFG